MRRNLLKWVLASSGVLALVPLLQANHPHAGPVATHAAGDSCAPAPCASDCTKVYSAPPQKIVIQQSAPEIVFQNAAAPSHHGGLLRVGHWHQPRPVMMVQPVQQAVMAPTQSFMTVPTTSYATVPTTSFATVPMSFAAPAASFGVAPATSFNFAPAASFNFVPSAPAATFSLNVTPNANATSFNCSPNNGNGQAESFAAGDKASVGEALKRLSSSVELLTKISNRQTEFLQDHENRLKEIEAKLATIQFPAQPGQPLTLKIPEKLPDGK